MTRVLDFDDGFESSTEPGEVQTPASEIQVTPAGNLSSTDAQSAFEELQGDIDDINGSVGEANGLATLDGDGKLPTAQLPELAITRTYVVADIAARDALIVQEGDFASVTDIGGGITQAYWYNGTSWIPVETEAAVAAHNATATNVHGITNTADLSYKSATETLENKTLVTPKLDIIEFEGQASTPATPAAGKYKGYVKDSTKKLTILDENGVETTVGSGAGGIEFITTGDGEAGTTGFTEGSYSAAARPSGSFTASSGAGAFAISTTSVDPISGNASLVFTKSSGASRQGRAVHYEFDLPLGYRAKVLDISANYAVISGTFVAGSSSADSSMIFYAEFYDGSSWSVAEPSSFKLLSNSTTVSDLFHGNIQTPYNATKMRLITYVAESADSAWSVKCELSVQPTSHSNVTPITDWQSYTPTGSWNTNTTYTGKWRRVGDTIEVQAKIALSGAPNAASLTINVPSSYTIDTSKLVNASGGAEVLGTGAMSDSGNSFKAFVVYNSSTAVLVGYQNSITASATAVTQAAPFTFGSGDFVTASFRAPILGWSSSVQMSEGSNTRPISFQIARSTSASSLWTNSTSVKATYDVAPSKDSHGGWDSTNNRYVFSRSATVVIFGRLAFQAQNVAYSPRTEIRVNGAVMTQDTDPKSGTNNFAHYAESTLLIDVKAGDYVELFGWQDSGSALNFFGGSTISGNRFIIAEIAGSSGFTASETVAARYVSTAGANVVTATTIVYGTKDYDTHGSYNSSTGIFTAPISGLYRFSTLFNTQGAAAATITDIVGSKLSLNGAASSIWLVIVRATATASHPKSGSGFTTVKLNAGDTIEIEGFNNTGSTHAMSTGVGENYLEIERVG